MPPRIEVLVTSEPIRTSALESIGETSDGAVVIFLGRVRDSTDDKAVVGLQYEAYAEMAEEQMRRIGEEACSKWDVGRITLIHRTGDLSVSEVSVAVAVSAPHRAAAFEACRYCIDTLKENASIWKKEIFSDGSSAWANHP